jgi:hypothetical protein
MHTDIQTHTAATHTTTLHSQHARITHSRRRGIAQPPTTASSSVESSNSTHRTLASRCRGRCRLSHYSSATLYCDCEIDDRRTRVARVRYMDCQRPQPQPPTTHAQRNTALPLQRGGNARVHAAQRPAHTHEQPTDKNSPTQRCAVTQQPPRDVVKQRAIVILRHSTQVTALDTSAGNTRPRRAFYIARMTQPRFLTFSQAQCTPHAHAD